MSFRNAAFDADIKAYIDRLDRNAIPWRRMFTAYGTAEHYNECLSVLEQTVDEELWWKAFNRISDFEHQSTMFPPAPFALVFLVRILEKLLRDGADGIARKLTEQFIYYAGVCMDAEMTEHDPPLAHFSDLLDDENLLPEDYTEDDLMAVYEDPGAISGELFYSWYHYAKEVLLQVPVILEQYEKYSEERQKLRKVLAGM